MPYRIIEGVHRSVAAWLNGLGSIRAKIDRGGTLGETVLVELKELFATKTRISRWDRGRDFLVLVQLMATEEFRLAVNPIEICVLPEKRTKYFTPLADVAVDDLQEEG